MSHFIRHSFLGGIATRTGLIITLGALLITGGFFALLWFGLAIYAAVAIGVLLVLLVAALGHRLVFSRIPSVLENTLGDKNILNLAMEFIVSKLWNPDCNLPIKILSSIITVLLGITLLLLYWAMVGMCVLLALCLVTLIAVPLTLLLSPLLMMFLASPVSLYFIVVPLLILGAFGLITAILSLVSALLSCFGYDNKSDSMLRIADPLNRLMLWGVCTILALFPTGLFVVYLLPSLVSTLTFALPIWATYVGVTLLFGVVLCGVLLYARQAVLDYRLTCLVESSSDQPLAIASIKSLLEQGATPQQVPTLKQAPALKYTRFEAEGMAYQTVLTHFFLRFFETVFFERLCSLGRINYDASIISNSALPLVRLCLTCDAPELNREYRGHAIDAIIDKNVKISETDKKLFLVKLLFECGEKYPAFYRRIKKNLYEFVSNFVSDRCICRPFLFMRFQAGKSFENRLSDAKEILYSGETGLKCGGVFSQNDSDEWFIFYYRDGCQYKKITSPEHIEKLKEHAKYLSSIREDKVLEAYQVFQRMTQSMGISIPLCDWKQAAKDMLYYAVKSALFSEEDLDSLLTGCAAGSMSCIFCPFSEEDKKAALEDLIESFKVGREELLEGLAGTLPAAIAGLIVGYCQPYPNPDKHPLPALDPDAVAATPAVG